MKAGTGKAKARTKEQARKAALASWVNRRARKAHLDRASGYREQP